jgi:hypothetical protein
MFGQFPFSKFSPNHQQQTANVNGSTPPRPPGKKSGVKNVTIQHVEMPYVDHLYDEMDDEESYKRKNTGGVSFTGNLKLTIGPLLPSIALQLFWLGWVLL